MTSHIARAAGLLLLAAGLALVHAPPGTLSWIHGPWAEGHRDMPNPAETAAGVVLAFAAAALVVAVTPRRPAAASAPSNDVAREPVKPRPLVWALGGLTCASALALRLADRV